MTNIIQIKRSAVTATPPSLGVGELAWSELSRNLFIGESGAVVTAIAGSGTFARKADSLALTGDATGTGTVNGGVALTLAASGVTAGSYPKVTVDAKGRVTAGYPLTNADIPGLDISKIISGVIPVFMGGTGVTTLTGIPYASGTTSFTAATAAQIVAAISTTAVANASAVPWSGITSKPTTIAGYSISDALGLSSTMPAALAASAAIGTGTTAAKSDHVHAFPTAANVGAVATTAVGAANGVASLDSSGLVPIAQLPSAVIGGLNYQGTWNATSNTPAIPTAVTGNKGWYYKVATAGATSISGITDWQIGDWLVSNGSVWDKIDNSEIISSVNGQTGAVSITTISGNAATASKLAATYTVSMTGDVAYTSPAIDGSGNVTAAATLANTAVTAASYGTATAAPTFTVDGKGRLTAAGTVTITPGWASVSGKPTTVSASGLADALSNTSTIDGGSF